LVLINCGFPVKVVFFALEATNEADRIQYILGQENNDIVLIGSQIKVSLLIMMQASFS